MLDQLTGPGVAQVVPAEVLDLVPCQGTAPAAGVNPRDGLPSVGEDTLRMLVALALLDLDGKVVQRHVQVVAILRILSGDPCPAALQVDLRPAQAGHIALAEPRGQREQDRVALVLVQLI